MNEVQHLDLNNATQVKQWDTFVDGNLASGHHHNTSYLKAILQAYPHNNHSFLLVDEHNSVLGIMPLIGVKSPVFGKQLVSTPFLNYGGGLVAEDGVHVEMMHHAERIMIENNYDNIELRSMSSSNVIAGDWFVHNHKAVMILDLPDDIKKVGAGNAKKRAKLRSQAGKAQRSADELGITFEQKFGGPELLDDFYAVFSEHMRDLGTPVYGREFFQAFLDNVPSTLTVVYWDGKPVSCGFLFEHGDRVSIPWASTLSSANPYAMNVHMYYHILEHCIKNNKTEFDFGRSTIDAGTYKFKSQWGAMPQICYWHGLRKDKVKPAPRLNTEEGMMGLLVKTWKRLPLWVACRVGPHIIKGIP